MGWVIDALATLLICCIDAIVYALAAAAYDVFQIVSRLNIFGGQGRLMEIYTGFSQRIYTALSIIMVFVFAYQMLMLIINPDADKGGAKTTGLIKDVIISVAAIVAMPLLFRYMTVFQNHVIDDNVIFKFVLGADGSFDNNGSPGREIAMITLLSFYHPYGTDANTFAPINQSVADSISDNLDRDSILSNGTVASVVNDCVGKVEGSGDLKNIGWPESLHGMAQDACEDFSVDIVKWRKNNLGSGIALFHDDSIIGNVGESVEYFWIICTAAGAALIWFFVSYAVDLGTRAVKLAFLELIAPIPLILRIMPNARKSFDTWKNELIKTYIDVFIRVATIAFVIQLCMMVPTIIASLFDAINALNGSNGGTTLLVRIIATVALLLGLLKFAKDAPALFKAIFSTGGTMFEGLNLKPGVRKRVEENEYAMKGISAGANIAGRNRALYNRYKQQAQKDGKNSFSSRMAGLGGVLRNSGKTIRGAAKDGMGENSAKTFKDLKNQKLSGAHSGSQDAFDSMDHGAIAQFKNVRGKYKARTSSGTDSVKDKLSNILDSVKEERTRVRSMDEEYLERKRVKARYDAAVKGGNGQDAHLIRQQNEVASANNIAKAAYKAAVDKKMGYWNDEAMEKQFRENGKAILKSSDGDTRNDREFTSWKEYKTAKAAEEYKLYGEKATANQETIARTNQDIANAWKEIQIMSKMDGMGDVMADFFEKEKEAIFGGRVDTSSMTLEHLTKLMENPLQFGDASASDKAAEQMRFINGLSSAYAEKIQSINDYNSAINPSTGGDKK